MKHLWYIGIFVFMFIWFAQVHPLAVLDADDWGHISFARNALPDLNEWNPAKLFPEILMSFVCTVAAYTVYPITGDYVGAISIMSALVTSGFITLYVYCFGKFIRRTFEFENIEYIYVEILFFILHFLIFRHGDTGNTYLFHCEDLTCYYNYLLPALLNASIVLCMIENEKIKEFESGGDAIKRGLFYVVLYLAIFSNLIDNIILVGYAEVEICICIIRMIKEKGNLKKILKERSLFIGVVLCWCVCVGFELLGGRASIANGASTSLWQDVWQTMINFIGLMNTMHKIFILFAGGVSALAIVLLVVQKKKEDNIIVYRTLGMILGLAVLLLVYAIMITAKVNVNYISRSEYIFGVFFYSLLFVTTCFGYIMKKMEEITVLIPLMLCVLVSFVNTNLRTFKDSNQFTISGALCNEISKDLVEQVIKADQAGLTSIELEVSKSGGVNNWPQAIYMGESMSVVLYKHGVTHRKIEIKLIPSVEYNEKYQLYQ